MIFKNIFKIKMTELLNKLFQLDLNKINSVNSINQSNPSQHITYYINGSFNKFSQSNNFNDLLMNNNDGQNPMDNGNDEELEPETPKMKINFNSNIQKLNENLNHDSPQKEKETSTNTETKATISNVNTEPKIKIIPTIQNLVATANLNCDLRLREIAFQEQNTKYVPNRFSGLIMRICNPIEATSLIFSNGKIVVLGAKTEEDSKNACRKIGKIIKSLNYPVKFTDFKIHNIVSSCDVRFQINLYRLFNNIQKKKSSRVNYEPEIFPGLIYRLTPNKSQNNENNEDLPNIAILIFSSGKLVITGAKKRNQIYDAFNKIYPLILKSKVKFSAKGKK